MSSPLSYGNGRIASLLIAGVPTLIVGDSIHSDLMIQAMRRCWRPVDFIGFGQIGGVAINTGGLTYENTLGAGYGVNTSYTGWNSTGGPGGTTGGPNNIPGWMYGSSAIPYGRITTFNGVTVPAESPVYWDRMAEFIPDRSSVYGPFYKWMNGRDLRYSYTTIVNSLGCQSYKVKIRDRNGGTLYATSPVISARGSLGYQTTDIDLAAATYSGSSDEPCLSVQATGGTTPASGDNLVHVCGRLRVKNASGMELIPLGVGGAKASDFGNAAAVDQTMQNGWVSALGVQIVYIWLGQNDGGTSSKAQYKADLLAFVGRMIISNPSVFFIICSPYQTLPASWTGSGLGNSSEPYEDACFEIAQQMPDRVLFVNMRELLGRGLSTADKYTFLNANYLTDSVHPTTAGTLMIQNIFWGAVESASASASRGRRYFLFV